MEHIKETVAAAKKKLGHDTRDKEEDIFTITEQGTPDPFVVRFKETFYMTFTSGTHITIWSSPTLTTIDSHATKTTIWTPPADTPYSSDIWAPELHAVHGRWHIYFAAADKELGNKSHRMYVLGGPAASEAPVGIAGGKMKEEECGNGSLQQLLEECQVPATGNGDAGWEFLGPVRGMPEGQWGVDGTVFGMGGGVYMVYSGWALEGEVSEKLQNLYIVEMDTAMSVCGAPVLISAPEFEWEMYGDVAINEGPQWVGLGEVVVGSALEMSDGHVSPTWAGIIYSASASWTSHYCLGALQYISGDPLDPKSWHKHSHPILKSRTDGKGPFGPGHASFVALRTGERRKEEVWAVFHATDDEKGGWEGRKARIMRVSLGSEGEEVGVEGKEGMLVPSIGKGVYGVEVVEGEKGEMRKGHGHMKELMEEIKRMLHI